MANSQKISHCSHVISIGYNTWEDIHRKKKDQETCMTCSSRGPNLWICIHSKCLYVGCGESVADHSSSHSEANHHHLTMNLTTMRIWCYKCEFEVYKDNNDPPIVMRDKSLVIGANTPESPSPTRLSPNSYSPPPFPDDSESDDEDEDKKPRGLTGLQNIGNTCYLNAAIQALSNCPPLTRYFMDCSGLVRTDRKPGLSRNYLKLMSEMWHKKRPSYVVPSSVVHGIKLVHPMFRGYTQQDTQEFLRCFMDQVHEELKQPVPTEIIGDGNDAMQNSEGESTPTNVHEEDEANDIEMLSKDQHPRQASMETNSQSDTDYETCDSGLSSERSSVEHNLSSGEEGNVQEVRLSDNSKYVGVPELASKLSQGKSTGNTVRLAKKDKNRVNPDDSAISTTSSTSTLSAPASAEQELVSEAAAQVKNLKESVNIAHRKAAGDVPDNLKSNASTNFQSAEEVCENGDTVSGDVLQTPKQKSVADGRLRQPSESDKSATPSKNPSEKLHSRGKKKKSPEYQSVISDVFDGKILSSVQCLTCERVSATRETFQDLSLPIPTKDHLHMIHTTHSSTTHKGTCTDVSLNQGWLSWMFGWFRSLLWGPTIMLQDCLAAFFSADELKGDNMYSCEKCKKLRNGVKYSKVLKLPEVLCIHLKRFRHEFMFSTKIGSYVSFPLEDLDMGHYLHKDSADQVKLYDLVAVICHHGTAGGGHYTAYALNYLSEKWYEFDDQYVTEVDFSQVENCEAYVLFYRKKNDSMIAARQKASQIMESPESDSIMRFYISRQWLNKFNTFADPGPITNHDFLCKHGGVPPAKWNYVGDLVQEITHPLWEYLHSQFKGGPAVSCLYQCKTCLVEMEEIKKRQTYEMETFVKMHEEFQSEENPGIIFGISLSWFKDWEYFVRGRTDEPPGPVDNSRIATTKSGQVSVKINSDHGQLSEEMWHLLHDIYGGGPEVILKHNGLTTDYAKSGACDKDAK